MTAPDLTLSALIGRVLTESSLNDPRDVAQKVAEMAPDDMIRAYFEQAVVAEIRCMMSARRNRAITVVSSPQRSAKVAQRRDWWAEMCAARVHVGGSWKTLGECGVKDLEFAESERRADAERELARADFYASMRKLLRKYKVRTVADLPAEARPAVAA